MCSDWRMSMKYLAGVFAALALAWSPYCRAQASPQNYPLRPVTLYVGFPAGSTNDSTARTMAHQLAETLGQQFIVINRDGMAGVIVGAADAKMKTEGDSLFWGRPRPL